jgi:hypothetical protein
MFEAKSNIRATAKKKEKYRGKIYNNKRKTNNENFYSENISLFYL